MEEPRAHANATSFGSSARYQRPEADARRQAGWPQIPGLPDIASQEELTLAATAGAAIAFGLLILKRLLQAR